MASLGGEETCSLQSTAGPGWGLEPLFQPEIYPQILAKNPGELVTIDNGGAGFSGAAPIRVDGANQYFQFAELRAFVIPEPSAAAMIGLAALGGMGMFRRRS